jgi:hypothetical protein
VTTAGRRDARLGVTRARMFASAKKPLEKREKKTNQDERFFVHFAFIRD